MSLELLKEVFSSLTNCREWQAHLLKFVHYKNKESIFRFRKIEFFPERKIDDLINEIGIRYTEETKNILDKYVDVREYDGSNNTTTIYKISESNSNINISLDGFFQGIADSDCEMDPFELDAKAYVLCGSVRINDSVHAVKLISMHSPITSFKNKFFLNKGKFKEVDDKVLNLRTMMNVVLYDKTIYLFDMSGEALFNIERAYKIKCLNDIDKIEKEKILSDSEVFRSIASSGFNPKRFSAFSDEKLNLLKNKKNREKVAKHFKIPLIDNSIFDTSQEKNAEKLVKVLCGKAMWDVLEDVPVEVDGSKNWETGR